MLLRCHISNCTLCRCCCRNLFKSLVVFVIVVHTVTTTSLSLSFQLILSVCPSVRLFVFYSAVNFIIIWRHFGGAFLLLWGSREILELSHLGSVWYCLSKSFCLMMFWIRRFHYMSVIKYYTAFFAVFYCMNLFRNVQFFFYSFINPGFCCCEIVI